MADQFRMFFTEEFVQCFNIKVRTQILYFLSNVLWYMKREAYNVLINETAYFGWFCCTLLQVFSPFITGSFPFNNRRSQANDRVLLLIEYSKENIRLHPLTRSLNCIWKQKFRFFSEAHRFWNVCASDPCGLLVTREKNLAQFLDNHDKDLW